MSEITITHTPAEGTLAEGTEKNDGSRPILERYGFRWGRSIRCFFIRNSRDAAPRLVAIDTAAKELRAHGHTVTVEIDGTVRDTATVKAAKHDRLEDRRAALTEKADKLTAQSAALHSVSDAMVEHLPLGQPVFPGARGRSHRKLLERSVTTAIRASQVADEARRMPARIEGSRRQEARREQPDVVARRVARLETDLRRLDRRMAGLTLYPTANSDLLTEQYEGERAVLIERINGDKNVLEQAKADGLFGKYSKANVHKDDRVMIRGEWRQVVRSNLKTVSVTSGYSWVDKYGYEEIRGLACGHSRDADEN